MGRDADLIRSVPMADIARRLGMEPSRGRWRPCPGCGADRVLVGERVITCHACGLRLDAVGAARRDGRTWEQAVEWVGMSGVGEGWVCPPPFRLPVDVWWTDRRFGPDDSLEDDHPPALALATMTRHLPPDVAQVWGLAIVAGWRTAMDVYVGPHPWVDGVVGNPMYRRAHADR